MMPPRPPGPGQGQESGEERRRKLTALRYRLQQEASALHTPADWARCLRQAALMPGADFANILLVSATRPAAIMVADYQQWTAVGRQVRRGQKGIEVFTAPRQQPKHKDEQGEREPAWRAARRVAHVWDMEQTTGRPPATPVSLPQPGDAPAGLRDALCWLARREGFAVEREHGAPADGTTFWAARRIRLPFDATGNQAVWALAHQLGHILLDHGHGLPAGATSSGCAGARKAEADSIAFIICARHGVHPAGQLPHPASWAGSDPRAPPAAAILATGQRITTAATRITRHTIRLLEGDDHAPAVPVTQRPATLAAQSSPAARPPARRADDTVAAQRAASPAATGPPASTRRILQHGQDFYAARLEGSWVPGYLESRGITSAVAREWEIGYAPGGWTTLTDHLRALGHGDDEIEAAGLATRSSRGTLIDRFRDRVMLPVHDQHGAIAGFIGRAHPDAGPDVPKYLNSPETAGFRKGSLLFGLHHARQALEHGAIPVIVEGPFDAIAVTLADPGRHAGIAPCGTALTSQQAARLSQAADLPSTGIFVAFDNDAAGRKAAARAYGILRQHTWKLQSVTLNANDPAEIVQQDGPAALRATLREHHEPLSTLVIDAHLEQWERHLAHDEGRYRAMRSAASLIAGLLPQDTAAQVRQLTEGKTLVTTDDTLRPVVNPQLPRIARILPPDTASQVAHTACRLDLDVSDVLAEVANRVARPPKGQPRSLRDVPPTAQTDRAPTAPGFATASFPRPPLAQPGGLAPAATQVRGESVGNRRLAASPYSPRSPRS